MEIILAVFGAVLGATFADVDLAPPLPLKHRSAWTHGPLIPLALAVWGVSVHPLAYWFIVGFLPTYALHLLADMFPKAWRGSALVNLHPLPWRLPGVLSFLYLASGVYLSINIFIQMTVTGGLLWN